MIDQEKLRRINAIPSSSGDLFNNPGCSSSTLLTSSIVPETGAYYMYNEWVDVCIIVKKVICDVRCRTPPSHSRLHQFALFCTNTRERGYSSLLTNYYAPPCLTSVPTVGSSTNTTSPKLDWAWSVIEIVPTDVLSSKTTASWSSVYFLAAKLGISRGFQWWAVELTYQGAHEGLSRESRRHR